MVGRLVDRQFTGKRGCRAGRLWRTCLERRPSRPGCLAYSTPSTVTPSPDVMSSASVPTGDDLTVICEPSREHLILHVFGELDLATAPALERQLENAWANDPPALVL